MVILIKNMTNERRNIVKTGADVIHYTTWLTPLVRIVIHYAAWLTYRRDSVILYDMNLTYCNQYVYRYPKWLTSEAQISSK